MRSSVRKGLAVLAGGTVLVGGGVTTLASWQDRTVDRVPLTLSRFDVQQTLDGSSWVQAASVADAAQVVLSVPGAAVGALVPGGSATGWIGMRVDTGSLAATVTMSAPDVGADPKGLAANVTYQAVTGVPKDRCDAGDLSGGTTLVARTGLASGTGGAVFALGAGTSAAPGATVQICLKLTLQDRLGPALSGASVSPTWTFDAESTAG